MQASRLSKMQYNRRRHSSNPVIQPYKLVMICEIHIQNFVFLPGGFSIMPLSELLSWLPGVSIMPGMLGRNEASESFIFLAEIESAIQHICLRFMQHPRVDRVLHTLITSL